MGNQESTRKISFNNDEPDKVVKMSDKVVAELIKQSDGTKGPQQTSNQKTQDIYNSDSSSKNPDFRLNTQANEIADNYENELQRTNEYWEQRIKELQESHDRINTTWQTEYQKALDDVDEFFGKVPPKDRKTPCSAEKTNVVNCYRKNAAQPLMCASEIKSFTDCMNGVKA